MLLVPLPLWETLERDKAMAKIWVCLPGPDCNHSIPSRSLTNRPNECSLCYAIRTSTDKSLGRRCSATLKSDLYPLKQFQITEWKPLFLKSQVLSKTLGRYQLSIQELKRLLNVAEPCLWSDILHDAWGWQAELEDRTHWRSPSSVSPCLHIYLPSSTLST